MPRRSFWFVVGLFAAIVPAMLMIVRFGGVPGGSGFEFGETTALLIAGLAPTIAAEGQFVGIATPAVFAGVLVSLAPGRDEKIAFLLAALGGLLGAGAYAWVTWALSQPLTERALLALLDQAKGGEATRKSFEDLENFVASARTVYVVLLVTLLGVHLRVKAAAAAAAALVALAALVAAPGDARAGQVSITGEAKLFAVSISLREGPYEDPKPMQLVGGRFVYDYGPEIFADGAYAEKTLVIEWTPKVEDEPAVGVEGFTVEVPLLLRKWRVDDRRRIEIDPFVGVGQQALHDYEWMREPAKRWTRFLASLQQGAHYAKQLSAESGLARRALNTAMSAFAELAAGGWVLPPPDLRERLQRSFAEADPNKHASLSEAVDNAESRIWLDLNVIEEKLASESCATVSKTFDFLEAKRTANERAYALQLARTPDLLAKKRAAALAACAAARLEPAP